MRTINMVSLSRFHIACASVYLGAFSFGYMIGYSSPAVPEMVKQSIMTEETSSWFGSIATFGAMLGCAVAGFVVERYGRKATLVLSTLPFLVGWVMIGTNEVPNMLIIGRLLTGLASGIITVVAPMFIAEISPKELRGALGSGVQLAITIGILAVYAFGLVLGWKSLALFGALFPVATMVLVVAFNVPDTPRFYLVKGRKSEAIRSLLFLRGQHVDVEEECRDIEESLPDPEDKVEWSEFLKPELLRPLRVSIGLMMFQQFSGINVVMFYTVSIFESAGFKENGGYATVLIGAVQVVFTLVACFLMDRAGRRLLLLIAGMGMGLSCLTLGYYYHYSVDLPPDQNNLSWLALASLIVYIVAFALGWGPIPMLVMSEIFPARVRGTASAIATLSNWVLAFLITKEFGTLQNMFGLHGTFWLFGGFCFLSTLFVVKLVPETKGKSLEDIELYFLGRAIRGV